jgi:hypothetical protein
MVIYEIYREDGGNGITFVHMLYTECKTPDHFPTNFTNQWCDFFHSSWNLQLYFFFFDVEEGVLGPEFHLLLAD